MKHFPIYSQGVFLGVVKCFKQNGSWFIQYMRDDRPGPIYMLSELAQFITTGDQDHAMLLAKIGYVARDIEEYTGCPLTTIPRPVRKYGVEYIDRDKRNPFLWFVRTTEGPWVADFMLPWLNEGRIQFKNVPHHSRFIFRLETPVGVSERPMITISGDSSVIYCSVSGNHTELDNVQATFCHFYSTSLRKQSIHNGYVYGNGEDQRLCL